MHDQLVKSMKRRQFLELLGLGGGVALVAACTPAAPPVPTSAPAASPAGQGPAATVGKGPVTLSMLAAADPLFLKGLQAVVAAFKQSEGEKWSYVDVSFDTAPVQQLYPKIETSVAAGATWDLLQADGPQIKHYAFNKAIRPLQEFFSADELKQWVEPSVEEGSYKGVLYAPPVMQSASLLFFNADLSKKHDVTPPQELGKSWTMEAAREAWEKATERPNADAVPTVWGIWPAQGTTRSDYITGVFRRGAGKKGSNTFKGIADDGITLSGYFDAPEAIQGMQFYQDLSQKWRLAPVEAVPNIFTSGKAAFQIAPDNTIGAIQQQFPNGGFNFGVTGIPFFKDGTQMTQTGSWHWGVAPNTKHLDEVVALIRFASGKEGSKVFYEVVQQIPAHKALLEGLPEYKTYPKKLFLDALTTIGVPRIQTPGYQEFQTLCLEANTSIAQGANVADTMHAAAKKMDSALAKYKGWNS